MLNNKGSTEGMMVWFKKNKEKRNKQTPVYSQALEGRTVNCA